MSKRDRTLPRTQNDDKARRATQGGCMTIETRYADARDAASSALSTRLFWRLVPLVALLVMLNYLDRSNLGFAALQMNGELGFTPEIYGTGAAIFFIGYVLCQIPANILTHKFGPRRVIAAIMIAWGLVAAAMATIKDPPSFYTLRFLLAVTEAGMIPGATFYISQWFPQRDRGRALGTLYAATALAVVIGGPISGALLELPPILGLRPWQWMFIIEALPTILLAFFVGRFLTDRPDQATWLAEHERAELIATLASERKSVGSLSVSGGFAVLKNWRVWGLFVTYFCIGAEFLTMVLWLPQIIRHLQNLRPFEIGLLTAVPYLLSMILMYVIGWHSDRTKRRSPYVISGLVIAAAGCAASAYLTANPILSFIALTIGIGGGNPLVGPFWSFATAFLQGRAAAVGIALLSAGSAVGGFLATYLLGVLRQQFGNFEAGLYFMAVVALFGAIMMWLVAAPATTR
jgi:MFS transporter, ACS family, tartrate transporter